MNSADVAVGQHTHVALREILAHDASDLRGSVCPEGRCNALAAATKENNIVRRLGRTCPKLWSAGAPWKIPHEHQTDIWDPLDDDLRTFHFAKVPSVAFGWTSDSATRSPPPLAYLGFAGTPDGTIDNRRQALQIANEDEGLTEFPSLINMFSGETLIPITGLLFPESAEGMATDDAKLVADLANRLAMTPEKNVDSLQKVVEWATSALKHAPPEIKGILSDVVANRGRSNLLENRPQDESQSVSQILQTVQKTYGTLVAESLSAAQKQFSDFIWSENLRLNKLISNLYLKLAMTDLPDEDLFGSVCHSVAEYFHCDAVSIFLRHQEEKEDETGVDGIDCSLQLYGAFGAWDRALKSRFVRLCEPIAYDISRQGPKPDSGNTLYFYYQLDPKSLPHRFAFRHGDDTARRRSEQAVPHQQAWLNRNLGTTCRNILGSSLRHPGSKGAPAEGVIRLENRRPRHLPIFRDTSRAPMFLSDIWKTLALRPYVRYLLRWEPSSDHVNNEVGWRRMYEELASDVTLFGRLQKLWYEERDNAGRRTALLERLTCLETDQARLIGLVTTAETLFQHLAYSLRLNESPLSGPKTCPSFFNLVNIHAAWRELGANLAPEDERLRGEMQRHLRSALFGTLKASVFPQDRDPPYDNVLNCLRTEFFNYLNWTGPITSEDDLFTKCCVAASSDTRGLDIVSAQIWLLCILLQVRDDLERCGIQAIQCSLPELVRDQYRGLLRCSLSVRDTLNQSAFSALFENRAFNVHQLRKQLECKSVDNSTFAGELGGTVADALAEAAMHSHTFSRVDEARLLFISRRVVNLMANRIVALGQSREVPANHNHVGQLCLDDYALQKLDDVRTAINRLGLLLERTLECWHFAHDVGDSCPSFLIVSLELSDLLDAATKSAAGQFELIQLAASHLLPEIEELIRELNGASIATRPVNDGIWIDMESHCVPLAEQSRLQYVFRVEMNVASGNLMEHSQWLLDIHRLVDELAQKLRALMLHWEGILVSERNSNPARAGSFTSSTARSSFGVNPHDKAPPDHSDNESVLANLRSKLDELIDFSTQNAAVSDPEFLTQSKDQLEGLCQAIGRLVNADTVAIFFEEQTGADRIMKMQAAEGALKRTLAEFNRQTTSQGRAPGGIVYEDRWKSIGEIQKDFDLQQHMLDEGWSLTHRIWHQGVGRIANSRREMDFVRNDGINATHAAGHGDEFAYPPERPASVRGRDPRNWTLKNVVRTFLGIPVFARGGRTDCPPQLQPTGGNDALRQEFLLQYRVIGILKLEGKQPQRDRLTPEWWTAAQSWLASRPRWRRMSFEEARQELDRLFREDQDDSRGLGIELIRGVDGLIDGELIDRLTESLDARWLPEDVELLVSIAMEIGRLLTLRTLNFATQTSAFFTENDIGVLNIRHSDIPDVVAAHRAAEAVARKVRFELELLRSDLNVEQTRRWASGRLAGAVTHDPIREITYRRKDFRSLASKLVQRASAKPLDPTAGSSPKLDIASVDNRFSFTGPPLTPLTARRLKGAAHWDLELQLNDKKNAPAWSMQNIAGNLQSGKRRWKYAAHSDSPRTDGRTLVDRVLAADEYHIEDWAGVRIKCGFLSDIYLVLDAIRARFSHRNIDLSNSDIESWLDQPQTTGYRGVHFVVQVPLRGLITQKDYEVLSRALDFKPDDGKGIRFPCEIQIRTEYETSWAWASHFLQYKSRQVRLDLQGYMGALSGLLYESDKIMDLVRQYLEAQDASLIELLAELRRDCLEPAFAMVLFGVEFAQHLHANHRLYGGRPHFQRLIAVLMRLVRGFQATDPYVLLSGLLIDMWMGDRSPKEQDVRRAFQTRVREACDQKSRGLLDRLACRLPTELSGLSDPCDAFGEPVPHWFWSVLEIRRDYAQHGSEEDASERLKHLEGILKEKFCDDKDTKFRCYVLEAAVQLSRLQELPHEPLPSRAIEELESIYHVVEIIRREIGTEFRHVWRQIERELREAADRLDMHLPIDWHG